MLRHAILSASAIAWACGAAAQTPQPPRDTSAPPTATARIAGRVVSADNGRAVKRARILATAAELPQARVGLTDDTGAYELADLPAGRYTVVASKTGFIALSYGQRRPLQAGTPLQLSDGQQLKGVDFALPRGGAIAGRILDEDGEPMPGATVRVMRFQYVQGDRQLVQAGTAQTDDRGQYRVWGLMPGDYYINASARGFTAGPGPAGRAGGPGGGRAAFAGGRFAAPADDQEPIAYAPTYFPGAASVKDATAVTLGVSQEALEVNFALQLVRTSRVSGRATTPGGAAATSGTVSLTPEASTSRGAGRGPLGLSYGARIQRDGSFTIGNVPPGRYTLRARSGDEADRALYSQQALVVSGEDVAGLGVLLAAGGTISGRVSFQATELPVPTDLTSIRVTAPPAEDGSFGAGGERVGKDGQFTFDGVPDGPRFIRAGGLPRGWALKSVLVSGRDVIDTPVEIRSGQTLANVTLVFTDKQTQISGTIASPAGAPVTDFTVLAFPADDTLWRPQSRQIMTARPDQNGKYQLRGLPPGEYYLALVDPSEAGEWFEPAFLDPHRAGATRVTLGEGDLKIQDFRISR